MFLGEQGASMWLPCLSLHVDSASLETDSKQGQSSLQLHFSHSITSASNHTQKGIPNRLQVLFPRIGFCF